MATIFGGLESLFKNDKKHDINAHILDNDIHPRNNTGISTLPSGTENQTLRHNGTLWTATDILQTLTTGVWTTVDNDSSLSAIFRNIVLIEVGDEIPLANNYVQGTILMIRRAT